MPRRKPTLKGKITPFNQRMSLQGPLHGGTAERPQITFEGTKLKPAATGDKPLVGHAPLVILIFLG